MFNDFNAAASNTTAPTTPSIPYFSDFRDRKKKKKHSKKSRSKRLKAANKRADAAIWQAGYLSRENDLLRQMILLGTAAERNRLNSSVTEIGLRLASK